MNRPSLARIVIALVVLIGIAGVLSIAVTDDAGPPGHPRTETVTLGGPGHKEVALPPPAQKVERVQKIQDAAGQDEAAHSDLRAEPPAAKTPQVLAHNREVAPAGQPTPPAHIPLATVNTPGCRTLPVRNYSLRTGKPSLLIVLHQTISPDIGWNGVLGNVKWFDTPAAQASSTYIVARTGGQCAYTVPEAYKSWAQAGFNSVTPCAIEVTETGREGTYLVGAGKARVLSLMVGCSKRWHIPLRHGKVSGCSVVRPGVVEHFDLGSCGGGHVDASPYHREVDALIAEAAKLATFVDPLADARRSHRIVHAKIAKRCRGRARRSSGCQALFKRNGQLHAKFGSRLS